MRKILFFIFGIFLFAFLCSCSELTEVYLIDHNGKTFEVNTIDGTINDGKYTYQYEFTGNKKNYKLSIIYPDGVRYECSKSGGPIVYWSTENVNVKYSSGENLRDVIVSIAPKAVEVGGIITGILLTAFGILFLVFPEKIIYLHSGWLFKNAEPTELALFLNKIAGIIIIGIGVISVILAFVL